ncbi:MAG: penicillin-binding protein 2 [Desulfuromonadales bacterium]|nr:penicillin-binding protein 2 [Desulfuromonadales bacterium]
MTLNPAPVDTPGLRRKFIVTSMLAAAVFLILALRLWHLQVLGVEHYRDLSERNRIRYLSIEPPRGSMFDRNGLLLIDNRPSFTISALRQEVGEREPLFAKLATLVEVSPDVLEERWRRLQHLPRYRSLPLVEDVDREVMERVQEHGVDLPGILVEVKPLRSYPFGDAAAHLIGYLGEITEEELHSADFSGSRSGDMVGKTGLERLFDGHLRGAAGQKRIEVNVRGKEMRQVTIREPLPGDRVYLTIDAGLQQAAEQALGEQAGAVVALDVHSGEVRAFVSRPSFDPALFARGIESDEWRALLDDPRTPLSNRVLRGQYPPGSTFKMVVALAALESGRVTPQTTHQCTGSMKLSQSYEYRCWKKEGHGTVDLHRALRESCDVWFYRVGLDIGIERIADAARRLGLGRPLGFPFGGERAGLIPDRAWKRQRFGTSWYDGETVIAAIGQGYILTTPLQLAAMTAAIANGGTVWQPQVVSRVENLAGETVWSSRPEALVTSDWEPSHLQAVRRAMQAVIQEPGGTAWRSQIKGLPYAGKTGTAQVVRLKDDDEPADSGEIPYRFRDHALFVAYAPADRPELAVAVIVEHGGSGSAAAAPMARMMLENYFGRQAREAAVDAPLPSGEQ